MDELGILERIRNRIRTCKGKLFYPQIYSLLDKYPRNIGREQCVYLYQLAKKSKRPILDIGSNAGLSTIASASSGKTVYSFEWFQGLPETEEEDGSWYKQGDYKTTKNEFEKNIALAGVQNNVVLYEGDCLKTIPDLIDRGELPSFSYAFMDLDLYSLYKETIKSLMRIAKGGEKILIYDYAAPGVQQAIAETMKEHPLSLDVTKPVATLIVKGIRIV